MIAFAKRALPVLVAVVALSLGWTAIASAQTIVQNVGDTSTSGGQPGFGQSFTATLTGTVTQIQVRPRSNATVTMHFYSGPGSGTDGSVGTPASSQTVNLVDTGSNTSGFQTIVLSTPLPVTAGQQYAFVIDQTIVPFAVSSSNPYAGGSMLGIYNSPFGGVNGPFDLVFTVTEVAAAPVPTMSEWMMILLGLMLAGGAALYIQRRQMTA
ncbi:IPTL-CTERM sorting domain-containing protein [Brevundimonas sp.]|uniref:IPTL-CTERM sorting domain-containing protein n=1 Tax=Brevundimonas sp. TaxID=1871086 RepID=UPI002629B0EC|nr:IPTL-CTERM sorting domain-containing protein [Brevundimonas sp.]